MPEGDTVWRTAHRLHLALAGHVVTVCDLRWPSLATVDLRGATTTEVVARGKHVLQRLDSGVTLHSHLRMDGQWRVAATDQVTAAELRNDRIRAVVGTSEWTCIGARLGMLDLVPTAGEDALVGHLGPDILGPDWDLPTALTNLRRDPQRAIGAALLDQRLPGGHRHALRLRVAVHRADPSVDAGRRARRPGARATGGACPSAAGGQLPPRRAEHDGQPATR